MEYETVAKKAFDECDALFRKVARTQSPDDLERLRSEQTELIKRDVEIFFYDHATGHI